VWTDIDAVDVSVLFRQPLAKDAMTVFDGLRGDMPECDPALIGNNDHSNSGGIQSADCLGNARQNPKIFLRGDPLPFREFFVDHTIAIEKCRREFSNGWHARRAGHIRYDNNGSAQGTVEVGLFPGAAIGHASVAVLTTRDELERYI
jgi:hypothetical protein